MSAFQQVVARVGPAGAVEGAAGSVFVEMPFRLEGPLKARGKAVRADRVVMRRINDVPDPAKTSAAGHRKRRVAAGFRILASCCSWKLNGASSREGIR